MTLAQALAAAIAQGLDRLDAQLLLLHAIGRQQSGRAWLLAHDDLVLDAAQERVYGELCERRAAGQPVAYLVGSKEFFGLTLLVDQRVLVPRPETETLVEWALELLGDDKPSVLDLGTGSGAIALAVKHKRADAVVDAVDASVDALAVAAANAKALSLQIGLRHASWFAGTTGRFDLIMSNPPYVAEHDPHLGALAHEPVTALTAGPDGLDSIRAIVSQATAHLHAGGWLLLEHGWDQGKAVRALLRAARLSGVRSRHDLAGIERCSGGQWLELG